MAAIVALAGKIGTLTVNAVSVKLTRWTVRAQNGVIEFATTGQTADADSQYWMGILSGLNSATIEADGYVDHNATAASRLIGDSIKFRVGTGAAGTVVCLFTANHGFSATVVVESIEGGIDVESTRPDTFRVTLRVADALTYTNA